MWYVGYVKKIRDICIFLSLATSVYGEVETNFVASMRVRASFTVNYLWESSRFLLAPSDEIKSMISATQMNSTGWYGLLPIESFPLLMEGNDEYMLIGIKGELGELCVVQVQNSDLGFKTVKIIFL